MTMSEYLSGSFCYEKKQRVQISCFIKKDSFEAENSYTVFQMG